MVIINRINPNICSYQYVAWYIRFMHAWYAFSLKTDCKPHWNMAQIIIWILFRSDCPDKMNKKRQLHFHVRNGLLCSFLSWKKKLFCECMLWIILLTIHPCMFTYLTWFFILQFYQNVVKWHVNSRCQKKKISIIK